MPGEPSAVLNVPERSIPIPEHLSPEARKFLAMPRPPKFDYPALDDPAGWKQLVAAAEAMIFGPPAVWPKPASYKIRELREGPALAYEITPAGVSAADRRILLDIHGGALYLGAGETCKIMALMSASRYAARIVSVDYRMPPDHPYPAALEDCLAFYQALLRDYHPHQIIVGGASAGGNLAAAMLLRARDENLPLPAAAVLLSPELDLTESGDSFETNAGIDGMGSLMAANRLYANGADLTHPYLSPLFGDFDKGFPPTLLTAGTRDLFLSNAVRMHRALRASGVPAELHLLEAAAHGAFMQTSPEEAALDQDIRGFCDARWVGR